jgi:hypothetical protein
MVTTKFNQQTKILEIKFEGSVILSEILDYIKEIKTNNTYPRKLKILTDSREAIFNFTIEDLQIIKKENNKALEKYDFVTSAFIIDDVKKTVLTMLYQEISKTNKYKFEIFATKSAAIDWLNKH